MTRDYTSRWLLWVMFMAALLGGIFGLLTAPWGVFPR